MQEDLANLLVEARLDDRVGVNVVAVRTPQRDPLGRVDFVPLTGTSKVVVTKAATTLVDQRGNVVGVTADGLGFFEELGEGEFGIPLSGFQVVIGEGSDVIGQTFNTAMVNFFDDRETHLFRNISFAVAEVIEVVGPDTVIEDTFVSFAAKFLADQTAEEFDIAWTITLEETVVARGSGESVRFRPANPGVYAVNLQAKLLATGQVFTDQSRLLVLDVNDPPVAGRERYEVPQDSTLEVNQAAGVLANDSDPDGDQLTASLVHSPLHGTLELRADGSFTYQPQAGFVGLDRFRYRAVDGLAATPIRTVVLSVTPVNDPPLAVADVYSGALAGRPFIVSTSDGVLQNDSDVDGDPLTAEVVRQPAHGTLLFDERGGFTYTADAGFEGLDGFVYQALDQTSSSTRTLVTLHVAQPGLFGDFNGDQILSISDLDQLALSVRQGSHNPLFDLTADGALDRQDVDAWLSYFGTTPGDVNADRRVDFRDFFRVVSRLGTTNARWSDGDVSLNGVVDFDDYLQVLDDLASAAQDQKITGPPMTDRVFEALADEDEEIDWGD